MTVTDYIFLQNIMHREKMLRYKLCRVVDPSKKVPDLNCKLQDRLLDVVYLRQQVPDLRSDGIPPPDMELVNGSFGSSFTSGSLGHRVIILTQCETRVFPVFKKMSKMQNVHLKY